MLEGAEARVGLPLANEAENIHCSGSIVSHIFFLLRRKAESQKNMQKKNKKEQEKMKEKEMAGEIIK